MLTFSQAAHHVVVVVCDEPASITDAYALIKVLSREHGVQRFQILANQTRRSGEGPALFQKISRVCDRFLNVTLEFAGSVPFDDYLRRAVQRQTAVVEAYPASISSIALKNLASRPISGLCHKVREVTLSSSSNEWWGPGSVLSTVLQ